MGQQLGPLARTEKAVIANALEARGQDRQQEALPGADCSSTKVYQTDV